MNSPESYGRVDRLLHQLAFSAITPQLALADIEDSLFARQIAATLVKPVFVTSLARAGTTMLLELIAGLTGFASHTYRDAPFVLSPLIWDRLSSRLRTNGRSIERAHGDGVTINTDSPEAFEEVVWKAFWPAKYREDRVGLSLARNISLRQDEKATRGRACARRGSRCARSRGRSFPGMRSRSQFSARRSGDLRGRRTRWRGGRATQATRARRRGGPRSASCGREEARLEPGAQRGEGQEIGADRVDVAAEAGARRAPASGSGSKSSGKPHTRVRRREGSESTFGVVTITGAPGRAMRASSRRKANWSSTCSITSMLTTASQARRRRAGARRARPAAQVERRVLEALRMQVAGRRGARAARARARAARLAEHGAEVPAPRADVGHARARPVEVGEQRGNPARGGRRGPAAELRASRCLLEGLCQRARGRRFFSGECHRLCFPPVHAGSRAARSWRWKSRTPCAWTARLSDRVRRSVRPVRARIGRIKGCLSMPSVTRPAQRGRIGVRRP